MKKKISYGYVFGYWHNDDVIGVKIYPPKSRVGRMSVSQILEWLPKHNHVKRRIKPTR